MATEHASPRMVVLGMGNVLLRDEGIGVHVAQTLQQMPDLRLEVIDGGTLPDAPLSFGDIDKLIIVDAVKGGGEPGAIYRFRPKDVTIAGKTAASLHQMGLLENLWLMERFGQKPRDVVIIGIEPENMDWGLELSPRLVERLPQIVKVVLEEANPFLNNEAEKGRVKR